jgi:hypothetical protein
MVVAVVVRKCLKANKAGQSLAVVKESWAVATSPVAVSDDEIASLAMTNAF